MPSARLEVYPRSIVEETSSYDSDSGGGAVSPPRSDRSGAAQPQLGYFVPLPFATRRGCACGAATTACLQHHRRRRRDSVSPRCRRSVSQYEPLPCGGVPSASRRRSLASPPPPPLNNTVEVYTEPVVEQGGERGAWETHRVRLTRVPGYGFGIAVSGGRDNPHFASGDPSIAVSDVLRAGPAEEKLQVNDRIVSVNGVPLDNVEYAQAVQVLRDSGSTVSLVVRRRAPLPLNPSSGPISTPQTIKITLNKASKKEDFGLVLGCRLFIKELTPKARDHLNSAGQSLCEGDIITRINNTNCADAMSLKEARKVIDACKERLNLIVTRDVIREPIANNLGHGHMFHNNYGIVGELTSAYSGQNLYVAAPSRSTLLDDRLPNSLGNSPAGRTRGPLPVAADVSQLDAPTGTDGNHGALNPPRPPPPRPEDYYSSRRQLYEDENGPRIKPLGEPRLISFQKEGSVGLRLTGGNRSGVYVSAVQPGSPAALQGLQHGDKILKVNEMEMKGVTREEAVLFLLSLQERIDLIVQHSPDEYNSIAQQHMGDSFHIKCHFHYTEPTDGEMSFRSGDVFHVVDTLHNGTVGAWQVYRIGRNNQEVQKGIMPNKARAEELATAQFNATKKEMSGSGESRGNFFKRRRSTHRRSKSLGKEHWDDVVFSDSISKFPAYERVVLKHPGFVRPVVLFGPVADMAREKLLNDHPDKFSSPQMDETSDEGKAKVSGITRLSGIRAVMDRGKHALLDITPNAVDRLNYAQFYPIVIFLKAEHKHTIKQLRQGIPKSAHKSSKKLLEQCQRLEKVWGHVFTQTITLNDTTVNSWYTKLSEIIQRSQAQQLWVSETKRSEPLSDDFLFPMSASNESRLSYASSPESDLDVSPPPARLAKASSDPSVATAQDNVDRADDMLSLPSPTESVPPPYTTGYIDSKYGFSTNGNQSMPNSPHQSTNQNGHNHGNQDGSGHFPRNPLAHSPPLQGKHGLYGTVPELPPRLDRSNGGGGGKPVGGVLLPAMGPVPPGQQNRSQQHSQRQQQTQIHRLSAQERLFGSSKPGDGQDETGMYGSRNNNPIAANNQQQNQGSLDRHVNNNNSYDSMSSSYDAYSTHQPSGNVGNTGGGLSNSSTLALSATRLGPNVPDDLKAGPLGKYDPISPPPAVINAGVNGNSLHGSPHRSSNSEHNSMEGNYQSGYRGGRGPSGVMAPMPPHSRGPSLPTVPVNTDYGKYSGRTNSASTADYSPSRPLSGGAPPQMSLTGTPLGPPGPPPGSMGPPGVPSYKPVPPPKPKHYRPPGGEGGVTNGGHHHAKSYSVGNGSIEMMNGRGAHNGQGYYSGQSGAPGSGWGPPPPSHSHSHSHPAPPPNHHQQYHHQGVYSGMPPQSPPYSGPPSHPQHPGHPRNINLPHNSHLIDLAGSREQRGSAFELYRKPQHMHNMSRVDMMNSSVENEANITPRSKKKLSKKSSFLKNAVFDLFRSKSKKLARQRSLCENDLQDRPLQGHLRREKSDMSSANPQIKSSQSKSRGLFRSNSTCDKQSGLRPILKRQSSFYHERSPPTGTVTDYEAVPIMNLRRPGSLCNLEIENKLKPVLRRQNSLIEYTRRGTFTSQYNVITAIDPIYRRKVEINHEPFYPSQPLPPEPVYQTREHIYDPIPKPQRTYTSRFVSENPYAIKQDSHGHKDGIYSTNKDMIEQRCHENHYGIRSSVSEGPYSTRQECYNQQRMTESPYTTKEHLLRQRLFAECPYATKEEMLTQRRSAESSYMTKEDLLRQRIAESPFGTKEDMNRKICSGSPYRMQCESPYASKSDIMRLNSPASPSLLNSITKCLSEPPYTTKAEMLSRINQADFTFDSENNGKPMELYSSKHEPLYGSTTNRQTDIDPVHKNSTVEATYVSRQEILNQKAALQKESPYATKQQMDDKFEIIRQRNQAKKEMIYQTRKEVGEVSERIREPLYVSKRELKESVIYESQHEGKEHTVTYPESSSIVTRSSPYELSDMGHLSRREPIYQSKTDAMKIDSLPEIDFAALRLSESKTDYEKRSNLTSQSSILPGEPIYQPRLHANAPYESASSVSTNYTAFSLNFDGNPQSTPYTSQDLKSVHGNFEKMPVFKSNRSVSFQDRITENSGDCSENSSENTINQNQTTVIANDTIVAQSDSNTPMENTNKVDPENPHTVWGIFDSEGGILEDRQWGVSLVIPPKAIAPGIKQRVYFTVSDPRLSQRVGGPPIDMDKGEAMLSPLVMCGPQGLVFLRPVTLRLPHCANAVPSLGLTLKATDTEAHLSTDWDNIHLPTTTTMNTVAVKVDHF